MKYSEGEWTVVSNPDREPGCVVRINKYGYIIADCGVHRALLLRDHGEDRLEEFQANACLIATAPDLLKALKGDWDNCVPNANAILSQALLGNFEAVKSMLRELCLINAKAIAKAEGA